MDYQGYSSIICDFSRCQVDSLISIVLCDDMSILTAVWKTDGAGFVD